MSVQLYSQTVNTNHLPKRFERKYYLAPGKVGLAYGLLQHICLSASEYPSEQINSLYFDTADLDQYERSSSGDFQKDKVRIRWYGEDKDMNEVQTIFIEVKSRQGFTGTKQRLKLLVPAKDLAIDNLTKGIVPKTMLVDTLARFGYFLSEMLQPVIKISYWRYRFSEIMTGQRGSLDCHIRSTMVMQGPGNGEKELELPGAVIEIKGQIMELPATLKRARMLDTDWTMFSKYSACINAHTERPGTVGRLSPLGRMVRL
ncbi:MAG: VTC domain-containing protein [Dehalococcoidales bacterium]|jgi:hypothetical protein